MHALPFADEPSREALRRACAELDEAEARAQPQAISAALATLARCYLRLDAHASAEACHAQALAWARMAGSNDLVMDLLCQAAEASAGIAMLLDAEERGCGHAARERARDNAFEASKLAGTLSDPACEAQWLIRVAEALLLCGDEDDAWLLKVRALDRMARRPGSPVLELHRLPLPGRQVDH